ncbi:MAG: DUF1826 domain-containing protein [Pseudomonadota bacterium]
MHLAREDALAPPVRTVRRAEDLAAIADDAIDAVIWGRPAPAFVRAALNESPGVDLADARFQTPPGDARRCVADVFDAWGWPAPRAAGWAADDVGVLARQFAQILSLSQVRLRVEIVRDDACRKFHRDAVTARLICTYGAPGTVYGVGCDDGDPAAVYAVPAYCPILLKGKRWPAEPQRTLVHRSPRIEGTGATRLVVVLDEAPAE